MNAPESSRPIHVVVAAIVDDRNVLIAKRPAYAHQGGLWEFPGGKVEPGETADEALLRELQEELDITVTSARPLIQVRHQYSDKDVMLDVWLVSQFEGAPVGREGQPIEWVPISELRRREFPSANIPIISALQLPTRYVITPEPQDDKSFLLQLERVLQRGATLFQFRVKHYAAENWQPLAQRALTLANHYKAVMLINGYPEHALALGAHGVHLSSKRLMALDNRVLSNDKWVAASCHNEEEVLHACRIGVDFIVVSPVLPTASHPDASPLGWRGFSKLCQLSRVPVFSLGGMQDSDLSQTIQSGGQGVSGIRSFWSK